MGHELGIKWKSTRLKVGLLINLIEPGRQYHGAMQYL